MSALLDNTMMIINPEEVRTFSPNGQIYNSVIKGGINITAKQENKLFNFRKGDGAVPNSDFLTNMPEAGKIGSTMEFIVTHVGFRVCKIGKNNTKLSVSAEESAALKTLLKGAMVEIGVGSDGTKIGDFSGLHLMGAVDESSSDVSTVTAESQVGGSVASNFIHLRFPIPLQKNVELRGSVNFDIAPDPSLYSGDSANKFAFIVLLYGVKVVST